MANEKEPVEQIERKHIINLYYMLAQFNISNTNIKTAYWISKNMRIIVGIVRGFENLRKELTETAVFKQYQDELAKASTSEEFKLYQKELAAAQTEDEKAVITAKYKVTISEVEAEKANVNEKYKDVITEADKELADYTEALVDIPIFHKIKLDNIEGIDSIYIPTLYDLIDSE